VEVLTTTPLYELQTSFHSWAPSTPSVEVESVSSVSSVVAFRRQHNTSHEPFWSLLLRVRPPGETPESQTSTLSTSSMLPPCSTRTACLRFTTIRRQTTLSSSVWDSTADITHVPTLSVCLLEVALESPSMVATCPTTAPTHRSTRLLTSITQEQRRLGPPTTSLVARARKTPILASLSRYPQCRDWSRLRNHRQHSHCRTLNYT